MTLHRCLARHEDPVVGLGVVARHALLVALAVVDVDVQHPTVDERLEVQRGVVAVEHDLAVEPGVEVRELGERRSREDRQRRLGPQQDRGLLIAHDDPHPVLLVQQVEDGQPLDELVGPRGVVREVGDDGDLVHSPILVAEGVQRGNSLAGRDASSRKS